MHTYRLFRHPFLLVIVAGVAIEIAWYLLIWRRSYPWREALASLGVFVLRIPAKLVHLLVVVPVAYFVWAHRVATVPLDTWWGLALLFLGEEFTYYWFHRGSHEIRWLWASHVTHHTPEQIHLGSAFRLGATDVLSGGWLYHMPLILLGFNPLAVGGMLALNLHYQFWIHTDVIGRLGPLEWVFNTPSHHRVHHASNAEYLDRNYGGIVIIWDRLFGTFAREEPETRIVYGLVHPIGSLNPLRIMFHEWGAIAGDTFRANSWRERVNVLFGRPGGSSSGPAAADPSEALATPAE
jgi:sterol desaturase/sphingolipid hydroxylase (fatty acid hydroxylase superfamily)